MIDVGENQYMVTLGCYNRSNMTGKHTVLDPNYVPKDHLVGMKHPELDQWVNGVGYKEPVGNNIAGKVTNVTLHREHSKVVKVTALFTATNPIVIDWICRGETLTFGHAGEFKHRKRNDGSHTIIVRPYTWNLVNMW